MATPSTQASVNVAAQFPTVDPAHGQSTDFHKALFDNANLVRYISVTIDAPSMGAGAEGTTNTALPAGVTAAVGDCIIPVLNTSLEAGIYMRAVDVAVADQVRVIWRNETAGTVDPASRAYGFLLVQAKRIANLNTN